MKRDGFRAALASYARALVPRSLAEAAPGLATLLRYPRSYLRSDLVAGVTVGAVAVPSSLAMAELAGVPVVFGLYGTFLPLAVYALLGTSRQHVVGPDSTLAALTAVTVAPLAMVGRGSRPGAVCGARRGAGVGDGWDCCCLAGVFRLGFFADFFGKPVLLGYINGVALIVIASQFGKLLGISVGANDFFAVVWEVLSELGDANGPTVLLSAGLLAAALAVRRFVPAVPPSLVVLALALVIAALVELPRSRDRGRRRGRGRPAVVRAAAGGSTRLPRSRASRGGVLARRLRRPDRDRAHLRPEARLRGRPQPRADRDRRRQSRRRPDRRVSRLLLQLPLRGQRLRRRADPRLLSSSPRRSSGSSCSSRCP